MVVYVELAFLENFLLDGVLLFLAVKCTRKPVRVFRLLCAAAVGGAEAVLFPLVALPVWASYLIKLLGGALLGVIASPKGFKACCITVAAFFALTFAFGGALTAAYSFFDVEYAEGNGFYIERAPVALVLTSAVAFFILAFYAIKYLYRYAKTKRAIVPCTLSAAGRSVKWRGILDSGNLLTFRGEPVCVVSAVGIWALFGKSPPSVGRIRVDTVNGGRESPVFVCDSLKIGKTERKNVYLTTGAVSGEYQIILHTAVSEENHEDFESVEKATRTYGVRRKRRTLPVRK